MPDRQLRERTNWYIGLSVHCNPYSNLVFRISWRIFSNVQFLWKCLSITSRDSILWQIGWKPNQIRYISRALRRGWMGHCTTFIVHHGYDNNTIPASVFLTNCKASNSVEMLYIFFTTSIHTIFPKFLYNYGNNFVNNLPSRIFLLYVTLLWPFYAVLNIWVFFEKKYIRFFIKKAIRMMIIFLDKQ